MRFYRKLSLVLPTHPPEAFQVQSALYTDVTQVYIDDKNIETVLVDSDLPPGIGLDTACRSGYLTSVQVTVRYHCYCVGYNVNRVDPLN